MQPTQLNPSILYSLLIFLICFRCTQVPDILWISLSYFLSCWIMSTLRRVTLTVRDRPLVNRDAPQSLNFRSKAKRCLPPLKAFSFALCVFLLISVNVLIRSASVESKSTGLEWYGCEGLLLLLRGASSVHVCLTRLGLMRKRPHFW